MVPKNFKKGDNLHSTDFIPFLSFSFLRRFLLFTEEKKAAKEKLPLQIILGLAGYPVPIKSDRSVSL